MVMKLYIYLAGNAEHFNCEIVLFSLEFSDCVKISSLFLVGEFSSKPDPYSRVIIDAEMQPACSSFELEI